MFKGKVYYRGKPTNLTVLQNFTKMASKRSFLLPPIF